MKIQYAVALVVATGLGLVTALDGTAPKFFVIIAFDNVEKAKAYSDNMKKTPAMRIKTTKSRSFIVEGK
jgi:uncharacterized protein (DUF1330 family)